MISNEFDRLVRDGFNSCLSTAMQERFAQTPLTVKDTSKAIKDFGKEHAIVLTISSHLFRILVCIHFTLDDKLKQMVSAGLNEKSINLEKSKIYDYLCEVGNVFCGAMKRELQKAVPSLGMSTPNILSKESLKYVDTLKIDIEGKSVVTNGSTPLFYGSYYMSAYGDLDYKSSLVDESVDSGELELF